MDLPNFLRRLGVLLVFRSLVFLNAPLHTRGFLTATSVRCMLTRCSFVHSHCSKGESYETEQEPVSLANALFQWP